MKFIPFLQNIINPYCQILENSSRIFCKIFIFRVMSQTDYLENLSNGPYYFEHSKDVRERWRNSDGKDKVYCKKCHSHIEKKSFKEHLENFHYLDYQQLQKNAEKVCMHCGCILGYHLLAYWTLIQFHMPDIEGFVCMHSSIF